MKIYMEHVTEFDNKTEKLQMESLLKVLFFISLLFPYIVLFPPLQRIIGSDTQPWGLVWAFILVFVSVIITKKRIPDVVIALWAVLLSCVITLTGHFLLTGGNLSSYLRSVSKYLTFIFVPYAAYLTLDYSYKDETVHKIFKVSILIWFLISILQAASGRPIIQMILPRASFHYGRNFAIGLAPEPAFMSKTMFFYLILLEFFCKKSKQHYSNCSNWRVILLFLIFLPLSLTGFFLGLFYILYKFILNKRFLISIIILILVIMAFIMGVEKDVIKIGGRVGYFIDFIYTNSGLNGIWQFLLNDVSFGYRLHLFTLGLESILNGNYFGNGVPDYPIGGLFSPLYETGMLGMAFVIMMLYILIVAVIKAKKDMKMLSILILLSFLMMTFSESLATPYVSFIFGMQLYIFHSKKKEEKSE